MAIDAGEGYIDIRPDTSQFARRLNSEIGPALDSVGHRMSRAGRSLTRGLSLPLVGLGIGAGKLALDFEDAFSRISALSNASEEDIRSWRGEVLELSGETAKAPAELAEALFFLSSAGLDASQIMPTLEASAKAAAAGLGETADVAKLTANVLNAFPAAGLKATDVIDTLTAAVREGSAEPDEFAAAMGRILPAASKAGVEFDQIAASLAAVSNIGLDVNEGVTAMRGLLLALTAPGTQAADTIKEVGLSSDQLRRSLAEDGLIATLRLLEDATNGDIDTLRKIVPNIRAMTGAFGLTGQELEKVDAIFRRVNQSTGDAGKAFDETAKGPAFRFRRGLNQLQVEGVKLGQKLLPIGQRLVDMASDLAEGFTDLSPATQDLIIKGGLLAIALGPVLRIVGGLTTGVGALAKAFTASSAAAGAWTLAIGAVGVAAFKLHDYLSMDDEKSKEWTATILKGNATLDQYRQAVGEVSDGHVNLIDHLDGTAQVQNALDKTVRQVTQAFYGQVAPLIENTEAGARWERQLRDSGEMSIRQKRNLAALIQTTMEYGIQLSDSERITLEAFLATGDYESALRLLRRALQGALGPLKNLQTASEAAAEAAADAAIKIQRASGLRITPGGDGGPARGGSGGGSGGDGRSEQQRGGDVYLDGERVGKWVERNQRRQAALRGG